MGKKKGKQDSRKGRRIVDGISTAEMSNEQLIGHIRRIQNELEREREERNFFMLEREKLFSLWSLAMDKIQKEKNEAQLREIHLDDAQDRKEEEVACQKQKIRYMSTEHLKQLASTRLDYLRCMGRLHDEFWKIELEFRKVASQNRQELEATRQCISKAVHNLRTENLENITELRKQHCLDIRRLEAESIRKIIQQREMTDLTSRQDLFCLQILKDEHINQLIQTHAEQLDELKLFYNDILVSKMAVISTIEDELQIKTANEEKLQNKLQEILNKCRHQEAEIKTLKSKIVTWTEEEKKMATRIKAVKQMDLMMARSKEHIKMMELSQESLIQKNLKLEAEIDNVKNHFQKVIMEMQKKSTRDRMIVHFQIPQKINSSTLTKDMLEPHYIIEEI